MKDITEFLKECRVNGNEKIDTNDNSFWKLKDLLEHYKEQCNIPVVGSSNGKIQKGDYYCLDCVDYPNTLTNDEKCSGCNGENIEWHNEDGTIEEL